MHPHIHLKMLSSDKKMLVEWPFLNSAFSKRYVSGTFLMFLHRLLKMFLSTGKLSVDRRFLYSVFFLELSIWYSPYASVSQTAVSSGGNLPSAGYLQCINGLKNMFWKGHVFDFIYGAKLSIDTWLVRGRKILILIVFRNTDSLFLFSETATLCRLPQWNQIRLLFSPWQISWLFTQAICSSLYSASWWLFHFTFYI